MNNEEFLTKWGPYHGRGIFMYILRKSLPAIAALTFVTILFIPRYQKLGAGHSIYPFMYLVVMSLFFISASTWHWLQSERRYKEILSLMESMNKCPACSASISPADTSCPVCGLFLKIE